jgi:hypothetical protein
MGVEKIHACPNHCILFHGDTFKSLDKCPRCRASQYKKNDLYNGEKPPRGRRGRRVRKRWYKILNPQRTLH